jgi:hypothetical protein
MDCACPKVSCKRRGKCAECRKHHRNTIPRCERNDDETTKIKNKILRLKNKGVAEERVKDKILSKFGNKSIEEISEMYDQVKTV